MSEENEDEMNMNSSDGSQITIKGSTEDLKKIKKALLDAQSIDMANTALLEENSQLKSDLSLIAEKQFKERCDRYGLEGLNACDPADIEKLKNAELRHSSTATLDYNQISGGLSETDKQRIRDALPDNFSEQKTLELEANSEYALINELEKRADKGDKTAKLVLAKLIAKSKPFDMEYNGSVKDLYRKPRDKKDREELNQKRQNWSPYKAGET